MVGHALKQSVESLAKNMLEGMIHGKRAEADWRRGVTSITELTEMKKVEGMRMVELVTTACRRHTEEYCREWCYGLTGTMLGDDNYTTYLILVCNDN